MADDRDRSAARDQHEQTNTQPDEPQGQSHPFLRELRQLESQGVPEEGAINPGPPLKPVRSGEFHDGPIPPEAEDQGEEQ